jgi:tetratricopeptide (TPR) repeat protein
MDSIEPRIIILFLVPVLYCSLFLHELGHALAGRAVGMVIISFGLGLARPLCVLSFRGIRIYFCFVRPSLGLAYGIAPELIQPRGKRAAFLAGGIVAHVVIIVTSLVLWRVAPSAKSIWLSVLLANGWLAIGNLLPWRFTLNGTKMTTDGGLLLQLLRFRSISPPEPMRVQTANALRGLYTSIGDVRSLRLSLLSAAEAAAGLDDLERAQSLLDEAESLPDYDLPPLIALDALLRAVVALQIGRIDASLTALDAAEAYYRPLWSGVGALITSSCRASFQAVRGDVEGGVAEFERLRSLAVILDTFELKASLLMSVIVGRAALSDSESLESLLTEYEIARREHPSDSRDLKVYRAVAQLHARAADWIRAEPFYCRALAALEKLASLWIDLGERERFLRLHSETVEGARNCLLALGKLDEAKLRAEPLLFPEEAERRRLERQNVRDRRMRRLGRGLYASNAVIFCAELIWLAHALGGSRPTAFGTVVLFTMIPTGFCLLATFLYSVVERIADRFRATERRNDGFVILALSWVPWVAAIGSIVFLLI